MKNTKGFTLVELIIVIVIVGILSIVAVPVYKGYTKKAMGTEAKSLIGSIATAERVYFAEWNQYYGVDAEGSNSAYGDALKVLDVDGRNNKYFTGYTVTASGEDTGAMFTAVVTGNSDGGAKRISVTLVNSSTGKPELTEYYGEN